MAEKVMNNVREKLSKCRELCAGMSEDVYVLTDYLSTVANDSLVPFGMATMFALALNDIENGRNGFACTDSEELPKKLIERKDQVLAQAVYFPQIIDEIATDEEFAEEFRSICKQIMGFNPPKRVTEKTKENFPAYIKVAVDWWANAIASPNLDNGTDNIPMFLFSAAANSGKTFSKKEINLFKRTLAKEIEQEMRKWQRCILSVDYHPCQALAVAGEKIGVNSMMGYPWKTTMQISESEVKVSAGYGAGYENLWTSN